MNKLPSLVSDKTKLLKSYFILLQISYVLSAIMALQILSDGFTLMMIIPVLTGIFFIGVQFCASRFAQQELRSHNYLGLLIALLLNTLLLPSLFLPVSLFGYYALLNEGHRKQFDREKNPEFLNKLFDWLSEMTKSKKVEC
jgi:heme/copper-type cytochrome/quinol oxidase subunit 3